MRSYSVKPFQTGCFSWQYMFKIKSMSLHDFIAHSLLPLDNIPIVFNRQFVDSIAYWRTYLCSFQFLMIMNKAYVDIFMQNLGRNKISNQLGVWLRVWLLDHVVRLCLALERNRTDCIPKWLYYFIFPSRINEISCCSSSENATLAFWI